MTQHPRQCKSTYTLQARMLQDQPRPSGYRLQPKGYDASFIAPVP
jgi:hypothetical protein